VKLDQTYTPSYARTEVADRQSKPHPQSRKLPDAEKEARRQARKKLSETQLDGQHRRRLQLAATQKLRDEETARLVKVSMERKKEREAAAFQAMLDNYQQAQEFMEEKKKEIAVIDKKHEVEREAMYNQWNDDVFMPIQNKIFEVVNGVDYKALAKERLAKMNAYLNASKSDQGVFLQSQTGAPGHHHQKLKVKKLRDPLKRLLDKRTEELAVLDDVEKEHAKRVQLVTAGIDPAALKKGKPKKPKRGTTRISVTSWLPQKYAGTPEGHFAHVMKTKKGSPVRRSFAHDPYRSRVSKVIHGDDFGRRGTHIKVESPWQTRKAVANDKERRNKYTRTQQRLKLRENAAVPKTMPRPVSAPISNRVVQKPVVKQQVKSQRATEQPRQSKARPKPRRTKQKVMPTRTYTGQ